MSASATAMSEDAITDEEQPLKMTAGRHHQLADDNDVSNEYLTCGELNVESCFK